MAALRPAHRPQPTGHSPQVVTFLGPDGYGWSRERWRLCQRLHATSDDCMPKSGALPLPWWGWDLNRLPRKRLHFVEAYFEDTSYLVIQCHHPQSRPQYTRSTIYLYLYIRILHQKNATSPSIPGHPTSRMEPLSFYKTIINLSQNQPIIHINCLMVSQIH